MKFPAPAALLASLLMAGAPWAVGAPSGAAEPATIHSRSGQFIVTGRAVTVANGLQLAQMAATGTVDLDANLAAVSAERVRAAFVKRLGLPDRWQSKIFLSLVKASRADVTAQITSTRFRDNWQYQVSLLNPTTDVDFVRALTQVLLLESANRGADRTAEVPLWLVVGLSADLLAREPDLLVGPGGNLIRTTVAHDPLAGPRRVLTQRPALSFDALSWPVAGNLAGEPRQLFEASAQLLVNQLLRLPDGPAKLRRFIQELPGHLNWQLAFVRGFQGSFATLLDVEKWWAVNLAAFTGRNQWQMWAPSPALDQLAEALRVDIETRQDARAIPQKGTADLQTVIKAWDYRRQEQALRDALGRLAQIRASLPPELLRLVDSYRFTLETYLVKRPAAGLRLAVGTPVAPPTRANLLAFETARSLDALDAQRENLRRSLAAASRPAASP